MFSTSSPTSPGLIRRMALVLGFLALFAAACGGTDTDATTAAPAPTDPPATTAATTTTAAPPTTAAPAATTTTTTTTTTTEPPATDIPASPLATALGLDPSMTYKVDLATSTPLEFTADELPVPPGVAEVHWYTYNDRYVVAFSNFDPSASGPLCPGASIFTDAGFEFVANAPTVEGACQGFPTVTEDPLVESRICQETLFYVTLVPSEMQGILFGTLEALAEPGILVGLTSTVDSAAGAPPIDLDAVCS